MYRLSGMRKEMWQVPMRPYGRPQSLVAKYIGGGQGTRRWYLFEVHVHGREHGVILMPWEDLARMELEDLGHGDTV